MSEKEQTAISELIKLLSEDIKNRPKPNPMNTWIKGIAATVLSAILIAVVVGSYTSMESNRLSSALTSQQLDHLNDKMTLVATKVDKLEIQLSSVNSNTWTKNDHVNYSSEVQKRFSENERNIDMIWRYIYEMGGNKKDE